MPYYECDCCGACCQGPLLVEVYDLDVIREPRLATAYIPRSSAKSFEAVMADLQQEDQCLLIAGGEPCKFLGEDNRCGVYPTRPNVCVAMQAGDDQCQLARRLAGLPPLQPFGAAT